MCVTNDKLDSVALKKHSNTFHEMKTSRGVPMKIAHAGI